LIFEIVFACSWNTLFIVLFKKYFKKCQLFHIMVQVKQCFSTGVGRRMIFENAWNTRGSVQLQFWSKGVQIDKNLHCTQISLIKKFQVWFDQIYRVLFQKNYLTFFKIGDFLNNFSFSMDVATCFSQKGARFIFRKWLKSLAGYLQLVFSRGSYLIFSLRKIRDNIYF
jgi:hypothetical protein